MRLIPAALRRRTAPASDAARRLIFHVGDNKTGSTSIQNALAMGRVTTPGTTLIYPIRDDQLNHNHLRPQVEKGGAQDRLEWVRSQMDAHDAGLCILSGEVFEATPPRQLRAAIDTHLAGWADEIRIIAYVRPHAARLLSSYAEQIKIGWYRKGLDEFIARALDNPRFHYADRFGKWRRVFGDAFELRPMIRERLRNGSVIDDFLGAALGDAPFEIGPGAADNESLTLHELMVMRVVQDKLAHMAKGQRHAVGWELARLLGKARPAGRQDKLRLPRDLAERIAARFADDAAAVDAAFFGGEDVLRAELARAVRDAPAERQSVEPGDHLAPGERAAVEALAELASELMSDGGDWRARLRGFRIAALREGSGVRDGV
ncbi:hypothetical protein E2L08_05485 [Palleronia sediminis]|uniref:Uncharacterized protein n=1 Tax=Palleronia sediminis TaxID=2547833 RepID=A0A4R6AC68_9RHOB|nr:hypothetical protein [Palleronia sediminis]TDL81571.1 hypothetical protein E2L08_05485 [Palleronia sediminis]